MRASCSPIPTTVKKEVAVQNAGNFTFKIPPQDPNFEVESEFVFRQNATLLTISPHMHVRGKDFFYELIYPDGKKETLLWVPRYDFGWQTTYWLTEPKQMPRGAKLHCVAHFDNSPDNLANPDPEGRSELGRADVGRNDVRLVRDGADGSRPDRAGHRLGPAREGIPQAGRRGRDPGRRPAQAIGAHGPGIAQDLVELVTWQILELVPQVDRVCITTVDGDKLRLKMVQDRIGLKTPFHSTSTVAKAAGRCAGRLRPG